MKLTSAQVQETLSQYQGQPIPEELSFVMTLNAYRPNGNAFSVLQVLGQAVPDIRHHYQNQFAFRRFAMLCDAEALLRVPAIFNTTGHPSSRS